MAETRLELQMDRLDARVARIEQLLPHLATREELHAAITTAVAPLATREELHAAIAAAVAPLASRHEMHEAIQAEGERARRHATLLFEDLRDDNRLILEHLIALSARVDELARR